MILAPPVLQFEGVSKRFPTPTGDVQVLRHIDLRLEAGEFVAVTGPSGSGKTTLLHMAALLEPPSDGRLLFQGQDISTASDETLCELRKQNVGMVFQQFCLLPHRTAFDNVLFRFRYLAAEAEEAHHRTEEVLTWLDLAEVAHRPCRVLSGGEMQRVAIARALALQPRLLVADEPTGNLDAEAAEGVMRCFKRLHDEGHTIMMVTHNHALLSYCSRAVRCASGQLVSEEV